MKKFLVIVCFLSLMMLAACTKRKHIEESTLTEATSQRPYYTENPTDDNTTETETTEAETEEVPSFDDSFYEPFEDKYADDGIEITVKMDKRVFLPGDTIDVEVAVKNNRDAAISIYSGTYYRFCPDNQELCDRDIADISIRNGDRYRLHTIWENLSEDVLGADNTRIIEPGETVLAEYVFETSYYTYGEPNEELAADSGMHLVKVTVGERGETYEENRKHEIRFWIQIQ